MKNTKLSAAIALAVVSGFAAAQIAKADDTAPTKPAKTEHGKKKHKGNKCKGENKCKGDGACGGEDKK